MAQKAGSRTIPLTVENVGHLLFGRTLRLNVAAWILKQEAGEPFYVRQAAAGVGYSAVSGVVKELERFSSAGLIEELEHDPPPKPRFFARLEVSEWDIYRAALSAIDEAS